MVAWDTLCLPKSQGGLGLRDPEILSASLGAKIWWRWLKNGMDIWANFWHQKYTLNTQYINLVKLENNPSGSQLWNLAWTNKHLIQNHCFWEVRDGSKAIFWHNSWNQRTRLDTVENLNTIRMAIRNSKIITVQDYWNPQDNPSNIWHSRTSNPRGPLPQAHLDLGPLEAELATRKIRIRRGPNILRWSHKKSGTFTLKEAYALQAHHEHQNNHEIWHRI